MFAITAVQASESDVGCYETGKYFIEGESGDV
jgi:hypothetical protein